jgi:pentatricopeptide repeat protein
MQFFISTRRDRSKVLAYYERMCSLGIAPTTHTYKLLIEAYATLDEPDIAGAEAVLKTIRMNGQKVESAHHAALIHAKGCVLHDVDAAIAHFEFAVTHDRVTPDSTIYQALLECLVANHRVQDTPRWVEDMKSRGVVMTPYIANTLIHGWALEKNIVKAKQIYESLRTNTRREPSTYEAMTRAYLAVEDKEGATSVVSEMRSRGYPNAVMARVMDLVRGRETKVDS